MLLANTPTFDAAWNNNPHALLDASGIDVGLPAGQMGNSEVGHLNIGAGRVVLQDLMRIADSFVSGEIENSTAFQSLVGSLRASGGVCHLLGLVSDGGVHSHIDHLVALAVLLDRPACGPASMSSPMAAIRRRARPRAICRLWRRNCPPAPRSPP